MDASELKQKLEAGEQDFRLIDIREEEELSHEPLIKGAEHIPMGKFFTEVAKGSIPKEEKTVLVCKSGGRCGVVSRELKEKGYDIEILEGGIEAYRNL